MIQGTSSSVGKSLLVAALCRIYSRRGVRVTPFKAQNMSNNAAVCADGSEIGRAQALQALAAGIEPCADMNPILLKPEGNRRSQVIVLGRLWKTLPARGFYQHKAELWPIVTAALARLRGDSDLVILEGAGSPVELNLREGDIVNMALARHARARVLLVGDIDRGGIFAQLLGTLDLLEPAERALVMGMVVNKFRGDPELFADGVRILQERGRVPVIGVVPYLAGLYLPEEDAVALDDSRRAGGVSPLLLSPQHVLLPQQGAHVPRSPGVIDIAVIRLPHIANFDDFDPLRAEPGVGIRYVSSPAALGNPHAIILPGTKNTLADLTWLKAVGLAQAIVDQGGRGTAVAGICGGYQILGRRIVDPDHVESAAESLDGLGLLPVETIFAKEKETSQVQAVLLDGPGWLKPLAGQPLTGYEIHMGQTSTEIPWLKINRRNGKTVSMLDGAASSDGRIWGCYLHGLFANDGFRNDWLDSLTSRERERPENFRAPRVPIQRSLNELADAVSSALDMKRLDSLVFTAD
jgi:adenosylcobyric acid synthase